MKTRTTLLALPLVALACADNNASVEIAALCGAPKDAEACVGSKCETQSEAAVLDLGASLTGGVLSVPVQVNNQLANNANKEANKLNTNDAFVREFELTIDGMAAPAPRGPIAATISPASSVVLWVPIAVAGEGAGVVHLKLRGVYQDTTEWETGEFDFPIAVCSLCLEPPPTCSDATATLVACPGGGLQSPQSYACAAAL